MPERGARNKPAAGHGERSDGEHPTITDQELDLPLGELLKVLIARAQHEKCRRFFTRLRKSYVQEQRRKHRKGAETKPPRE